MAPFGGLINPNEDVERLFEKARRARLPYDRNFLLNTAFFLSWQYVEWNPQTFSIRAMRKPVDANGNPRENVPRPVSNKIQHFVLQEHSMALNTRPTVDVLPANEDPMAISNANVLLAYLNWLSNEQVTDFDGRLAEATLWALAAGEGWLKWTWDPRKPSPEGGMGRGDISVPSPLDVYPDPYARTLDAARYIFHRQVMDVEQIYDMFGVQVPPQNIAAEDPNRAELMGQMGMATVLEGAPVTELWMKPSRRHPHGLYTVWSGRQVLAEPQDFPYDHMQLPFTIIGSIPRPGQLHYTCAVETMRPEQMELNNYHAQTIMLQRFHSNPKWWIPEEIQLQAKPNDAPNQILTGQGLSGLKPEIIQPAISPNMDAMGQWLRNEMMDSVGVHEVSQAQVPGRVEAAAAIELLKESDNGRLAELLRTQRKAIALGFYQQARLLRQFGSPKTAFVTYSREGFPEVKQLWKTQIDPAIQVRVTMQGGIGQSRAAREDRWMTMWSQGIISDPHVMAELMDVPISTISPDNAFDIKQQRNENLTMAMGRFIKPASWENHEIHLRELNNYRKTSEYRQLDTKRKQYLEAHGQLHEQLWAFQLGKQLSIQRMAAAVEQGLGFQMGGGQPGQPGQSSTGQAAGGDQQAPTGAQAPIPAAAGAQPQTDPFAVRDTPQAQAQYRNRTSAGLSRPRM